MDYFQGIVAEYLRADRSCFINTEFCLLNDLADVTEHQKKFWYVDILALQMEKPEGAYLCEVTYARPPAALIKRLQTWYQHWPTIRKTLMRDAGVPEGWKIRPWIFVPNEIISSLVPKLLTFDPAPKITPLEMTLPWNYRWNRKGESEKPLHIPEQMRRP